MSAGGARAGGAAVPMAPIDLVSLWMETPERPLDFVTIHRFRFAPPAASFARGMDSARHRFVVSGSRVGEDGRTWVPIDGVPPEGPRALTLPHGPDGDAAGVAALHAFVDAPIDLTREPPVKQLLVVREGQAGATVATRFHHAGCDGVSAAAWLAHQWNVSFDQAPAALARTPLPLAHAAGEESPRLRRHPAPRRRGPAAPWGPSPMLSVEPVDPVRARSWQTITFSVADAGRAARAARGETDPATAPAPLMAAAFLDALAGWDRARRGWSAPLGLWLPVNIRMHPQRGFGNGTSRIRVHARWNADTPWPEVVRDVRRQMTWSLRHGEWSLPAAGGLLRLPAGIARPMLRAYLRRPWVDMASAVFTYVPRHALSDPAAPWAAHLLGVESVGLLHRRHPISLIVSDLGAGAGAERACTFTHDPALLPPADVADIARRFLA
ncbi:MAG: hypothetical protein ABUS79_29640, partial [Pseudomonadota bacterium]